MLIVQVNIDVKKEFLEEFINATIENAKNSINEDGIARFDLIQNNEDPTNFQIVEVFRNNDAPAAHKETGHYKKWKSEVEKMMTKPRSSKKFNSLFPGDENW